MQHPALHLLVNQFYTFLDFFFVLSGFLIYYKYNEISSLGKLKLRNYFVNRVSRVFPILIILVTLTFAVDYAYKLYTGPETVRLYLLNISLLKGFSSHYLLTGIGPSWSLSVEELFYLLSPFIFLFITGYRRLFVFILMAYAAGGLITWLLGDHPYKGFFDSYTFTGYFTFFGRAFEFACGIFLAMFVTGKLKSSWLSRIGKSSLPLALVMIIGAVGLLFWTADTYDVAQAIDIPLGIAINNLLMPVGITLLFFSLVYHRSWLQRFLSTSVMQKLGNATYSFYLLHTSVALSLIIKYISSNVAVIFALMILLSVLFHHFVEQPLAVFLRRKLSKKQVITS